MSRKSDAARDENASQMPIETQRSDASQGIAESQLYRASHAVGEAQRSAASHHGDVSQTDLASRRESLEYLKLVVRRLYDAQKLRIQSDLRVQRLEREGIVIGERIEQTFARAHDLEVQTEKEYERIVARELKQFDIWSKWLKDVKGIGPRIAGLLVANIADPRRFDNVAKLWAYCGMHTLPTCQDCGALVSQDRIETQCLTASQVRDATQRSTASHNSLEPHNANASQDRSETQQDSASQRLSESRPTFASQRPDETHWMIACQKCGSANIKNAAARRRAGHKANWSSELKTTLWKAAGSFVKTKGPYRSAYETHKDYLIRRQTARNEIVWKRDPAKNKNVPAFLPEMFHDGNLPKAPDKPEWTLGRIDAMAKRWTAKLFLSHLWAAWREIEGLPVTRPFVFTHLGHKDYVSPWMMTDDAKIDEIIELLKQKAA